MRRGLFLFLIVLTTLRGLVGPAMATTMVLPHTTAAPAAHHGMQHDVARVMQEQRTSSHGDHHGHASAPVSPADTAVVNVSGECHDSAVMASQGLASDVFEHCGSGPAHAACADCDICHTAVLAPPSPHRPTVAAAPAGLDLQSARFASAAPAPVTKPPIS